MQIVVASMLSMTVGIAVGSAIFRFGYKAGKKAAQQTTEVALTEREKRAIEHQQKIAEEWDELLSYTGVKHN